MLLKYFEGENLSGEQPLALALPMRVSMRVWNMDATRFASIFMGHNVRIRFRCVVWLRLLEGMPVVYVAASAERSTILFGGARGIRLCQTRPKHRRSENRLASRRLFHRRPLHATSSRRCTAHLCGLPCTRHRRQSHNRNATHG